jgi:hypothetical protein
VSTPVTGSLKVTAHDTPAALVGLAVARVMEETVGGVASLTTVTEVLAMLDAVQEWYTAVTWYVYVPSRTLVSLHVAPVNRAFEALPQAAVGVAPANRRTK